MKCGSDFSSHDDVILPSENYCLYKKLTDRVIFPKRESDNNTGIYAIHSLFKNELSLKRSIVNIIFQCDL